ncbi:lipopolysaccharide ABC superfamily ATP binding c assette transporter, ABC protein [Helicobacter pylori]|nr:lipopolysaccharide ABC superfamily ATP binding c assette transporter, ABC protein [Helicobacter pylori]
MVDGLDLVIRILIEVVIGFYALRAIGVVLFTHHILQALRVRDFGERGGDAVISVAQFAVSGFEMH